MIRLLLKELHRLWDTALDQIRSRVAKSILTLVSGTAIYFLRNKIPNFLQSVLTVPIVHWQAKEVTIFLSTLLLISIFSFLLGRNFKSFKGRKNSSVPSETFRIVPTSPGICLGPTKSMTGQDVFHLEGRFRITNIHSAPVHLVRCELPEYSTTGNFELREAAHLYPYQNGLPFPSQGSYLVYATFVIPITRVTLKKELVTNISFTDSYENNHLVRNFHFIRKGN